MGHEFFCKMRIVGGVVCVLGQRESARLRLGLGLGSIMGLFDALVMDPAFRSVCVPFLPYPA